MPTFWIEKLSTMREDQDKWSVWVKKADESQPEMIFTPAQREAIERGSFIVVGQRQEAGTNSWVYCTTGYVVLAGRLKNRIRLEEAEIHRGWIET